MPKTRRPKPPWKDLIGWGRRRGGFIVQNALAPPSHSWCVQ